MTKECAVCGDRHEYIYTCIRCKTTQCHYGMRRIVGTHQYLCNVCAERDGRTTEPAKERR